MAEDFAASKLSGLGYKIISRNFRSRFGEIDIIAIKDSRTVFIEVKARKSFAMVGPLEAVTPGKISKIKKTADFFLIKNPNIPRSMMIQVVSIEFTPNSPPEFKIIDIY